MQPTLLHVNFQKAFWPSGYGTTIGSVGEEIEEISKIINAPIIVEKEVKSVIVCLEKTGPVSFYFDPNEDGVLIAVDEEISPYSAADEIDEVLGKKLKIMWPIGRDRN